MKKGLHHVMLFGKFIMYHVSGTDYCTFSTPWETKRGNYTVPAGVSGIFGNPKYYGWHLHVDYDGKDDYWHKR